VIGRALAGLIFRAGSIKVTRRRQRIVVTVTPFGAPGRPVA
jgi:hypothetical protein